MALFGKNATTYYSSALKTTTSDSDALTWVAVTDISDETDNFSPTEVDITTRETAATGWEATAVVLNAGEVNFTMLASATNTVFAALRTAFLTQTQIAMLFLSGGKTATTSVGLAANFSVAMKWNKAVKGVQSCDFTLKVSTFPENVTGSATL